MANNQQPFSCRSIAINPKLRRQAATWAGAGYVAENCRAGTGVGGERSSRARPVGAGRPVGHNLQQQPRAEENIPTINLDEEQDEVRLEDVPF